MRGIPLLLMAVLAGCSIQAAEAPEAPIILVPVGRFGTWQAGVFDEAADCREATGTTIDYTNCCPEGMYPLSLGTDGTLWCGV